MLSDTSWKKKVSFPSRVYRLIENKLKPDAIFCFNDKPLILFFNNPKNKQELHQAIWNFNESPVSIIIENDTVEIFNGFSIDENTKLLKRLGGDERLNDFNYFELVTGKTWEKYNNEFLYPNRVDCKLLENIEAAQTELCGKHNVKRTVANALLGKVIFIRYLIDRKVKLNFDGKSRPWTNEEFCKLLETPQKVSDFFQYLQDGDKGFNGDLFPIPQKEFKTIPKAAFKLLQRLLSGEEIVTGQLSLFQLYDFSILPIEFISNVYEKFIGKENQAKTGAYYTPTFLVDYIISETVDKKISSSDTDYTCRVLDPACGSGIFLVETLRKIIEKYIDITGSSRNTTKFRESLKKLAIDNIFGIDEDESAIQVAIFSIYLTLLDYLQPAEIENFKFPNLLNTNFFNADFFNLDERFNAILSKEKIEFDFIVGNPPWMRGKNEKQTPLYVKYIDGRGKKDKAEGKPECKIGNREIAQAFLLRSSDFSTAKTKCALIVTSKVLYNLQSKDFRDYFLNKFFIQRVFELAPVRREVFDRSNKKATAPACILFFNYADGTDTSLNIIDHIALKPSRFFSLFKIFIINRTDFKRVQQGKLTEFPWLWKVLVYGSYLDFNFLLRLENNYKSIKDFLSKKDALPKQGFKRKDGDNKIDISQLLGWDFLDLKKEIDQYYITSQHEKWDLKEVGYIYRENNKICTDIFTPPMLLIKETVNTRLESISAISTQRLLFTDKVTSVKFRNTNEIDDYYLIAGLMNSALFAYYVLHKSSTAGIMIEQQINDEEKFSFPFSFSKELIKAAKELEKIINLIHSNELLDNNLFTRKIDKELEISNLINRIFELDTHEKDLVEYAKNITIPIAMKNRGYEKLFNPVMINDAILENYANVFIDRFKSSLGSKNRKFIVEIWHTNQIVGILFKVIPQEKYTQDIIFFSKQNDADIIPFLFKVSSEKITEKLFVQKDIRGFDADDFYIFKPNEKRLWHKAVAYLDVNEFADALLKAGRGV